MTSDELSGIDEDLFDFDELLRDAGLDDQAQAAFDAVIETTRRSEPEADSAAPAATAPVAAAPREPAAPLPRPVHRPHKRPPPLAPPRADEIARTWVGQRSEAAPVEPGTVAPATTTVLQRITLSPALIAVLAVIALLNLALVAYVVRALGSVEGLVHEVGGQVITTTENVRDEASDIARRFDENTRPVAAPRTEGAAALERAHEMVARGEFHRARETLFALLAVADRIPAAQRRDIEAQARFLVADTWRLEAAAQETVTTLARGGPQ